MKNLPLVAALVLLAACSGNPAISKQLKGSDSLAINFNYPQSDSIRKTVATTENFAIEKLSMFVAGKPSEAYKCGYDGNCLFYKKGILVGNVSFNYSGEGCRHFLLMVDDKLTPTIMSIEAADFLKKLSEGGN